MLRHPVSFGHNSFAFNTHLDAAGVLVPANAKNAVILDEAIVTPGFRDVRDPYHLAQGGSLGRVHKGLVVVRLRGRIEVPDASQQATLGDRDRAMRAAFDPYECYLDSPTTDGAYALDHSAATTDTATYPSGLIPVRYYVRPAAQPEISEVLTDLSFRTFRLVLVGADPRLYEQSASSVTLSPASPSLACTIRGTTRPPWTLTITMAGAGHAAFSFDYAPDGVSGFTLNLSGTAPGDVIVVTGETSGPYGQGRRITKNGVDNFGLKTSGPASWPKPSYGAGTATIANHTNITSAVFAWTPARA